jgi:hypothetical protein
MTDASYQVGVSIDFVLLIYIYIYQNIVSQRINDPCPSSVSHSKSGD